MSRHSFMLELEEVTHMHMVERMTSAPAACLICGNGNIPGDDGTIGPFIDLEREVNWDDSTYLCLTCAQGIGALAGMPTADELLEKDREIRRLKKQLHEAKARRRERVAS